MVTLPTLEVMTTRVSGFSSLGQIGTKHSDVPYNLTPHLSVLSALASRLIFGGKRREYYILKVWVQAVEEGHLENGGTE